jgi:hypothetical protein
MLEEIFTSSSQIIVVLFWVILIGLVVLGALQAKNKI